MEKAEIIQKIVLVHQDFISFLRSMNEKEQQTSANGKWSPIQQASHLHRSIQPLATGLLLPTFILNLIFGKSKRKSRTYAEIEQQYKQKLAEGAVASRPFTPPTNLHSTQTLQVLEKGAQNLSERLKLCSENQLDSILLPHPFLGKITLREMMYFTIIHVQHHHQSLQS